jgi:hypothetical protein
VVPLPLLPLPIEPPTSFASGLALGLAFAFGDFVGLGVGLAIGTAEGLGAASTFGGGGGALLQAASRMVPALRSNAEIFAEMFMILSNAF